jgi:hypothetical protein
MQCVCEGGVDLEQRVGCALERLVGRVGGRAQRRADDADRMHHVRVMFVHSVCESRTRRCSGQSGLSHLDSRGDRAVVLGRCSADAHRRPLASLEAEVVGVGDEGRGRTRSGHRKRDAALVADYPVLGNRQIRGHRSRSMEAALCRRRSRRSGSEPVGRCRPSPAAQHDQFRSRSPEQERSHAGGEDDDQCAGGGVEQEVVAGGDDHEDDERGVGEPEQAREQVASVAQQGGTDDERVPACMLGMAALGL